MKIKKLKFLSERELGWLLLRQVCQFYDSGGISSGRSPQSRLLDAWMSLEKQIEVQNIDDWTVLQLEEEAKKRQRHLRFAPSMEPFPLEVSECTKRQLGYCLLRTLIEWYRTERAKDPEEGPSRREMELLKLALDMLYSASFEGGPLCTFEPKALFRESDVRFSEKVRRDMKRRI